MCSVNNAPSTNIEPEKQANKTIQKGQTSSVFASGCFWCVEAVFESVTGVDEAVSGYAGGSAKSANYSDVSGGRTDHAEAVEVFYDPKVVSYETLLKVFFGSQDPTTLNQQGPDRGTQYRSTIFYKNEAEKVAAEKYIAELTKNKVFDGPITTTLEPLVKFYDAEDYHQDYEARNPNQPYVRGVSLPRLNRFKAKFPELLKKGKGKH
jgi:peptide-methionine (S)-S-oxide reductase